MRDNISFFDKIYRHNTIESTFTEAKKIIKTKQDQGNFLIIADKQTSGMGRQKNQWYSPHGGLWFTAGIYNLPVKNCITIFTALMIVKTIVKFYPETAHYLGVKWPNDLILGGKKLGGILTSYFPSMKYLLIGVGINTNNNYFPEGLPAVSLSSFLKNIKTESDSPSLSFVGNHQMVDHQDFLNETFTRFGDNLHLLVEHDLKPFVDLYRHYSVLEGKTITLATDFEDFRGVVKGINKQGALLLKLDNGFIQPFLSGSVLDWT